MTEASFSTNELFLRSDRIAFGKIPPEVLVREERTIILPDTTGQRLFIGLSTLVSTNTYGNLETIYPGKASFTFDVLNNKFGIGVSSPQYSLDIQTTTGLRLSGGSLIANAFGLFSVQTQALISTLPTSAFAPGTIPVTALASSGTSILSGISVPTSALYGKLAASFFANSTISLLSLQSTGTIYATQFIGGGAAITGLSLNNINTTGIENLFSANTLSLSTLASTGQIWLRNGSIISPYISTGTLYTNTLYPTTISTGSIITGTLVASSFTVASFTASTVSSIVIETGILRASQIYGDGYMITNLNPANITGTLPPERFGYRTISFDAINPYGNFLVQAGTVTLNAPTTASNVVVQGSLTGSNIASFSSMVYASSFQGDGYNLSNLNVPNWENLKSTVAGLGSAGYISSLAAITKELLISSIIGLGTAGYVSTASLVSTTEFLLANTGGLTSTTVGLGTLGYVSTASLVSTTAYLLANSGGLTSTTIGLGTLGYVSTASLVSTTAYLLQNSGNDSWITTNLINPPSSLIFGTPISKSSQIFIPWTYPTQTNVGFQSSWLPVINNFNTIISTNIVSINPSTIISTLSTGYVNYHNSSNYITGIVLAKIKGTSGIQSITFPQDGLQRSAYIYYEPSLSSISTSGQLTSWYGNYNVGSNVVSTIFTPFVAPGAPSVPQKLQSTNVTSNSLSFYFSTPQFADVNDPTSVATITQYDLSFNSIPIPGLRYGTVQCNAQAPTITTPFTFVASPDSSPGQVIQYAAANLFPDSTYRFYVKAKNSGGLYGPQASTLGISTSYLTPATVTGPSFTSRYYSGTVKRASDNTTITTLVNTNTDWTSANFIVPVQTVAARGSQAIGIIAISTFFTTPSTIRGPTVFTNGFPASLPSSLTQSSMTVSTTNVYDNYAASITAYQGFYLNTSNNVTIKNSIFQPNSTIYTFNTVSYQSTSAGVTSNQTQQTFHYDGSPGTATITDLTFNYATSPAPTNNYVSGVRVISGTPQFSTITGASNLGQWFYVSPIVTLSNTIGTTVTSLTNTDTTNVISGFSNGQFLPATRVVFSNALTANSLATTFASSIIMTAVCSNVTMTSAQITATNISSIIDGPSVTLIGSTLPAVLQTLNSGTPATGCRIWSFSSFDTSNIYVPPYIFGCNGTNYSYTNYLYDTATFHSYSLVDAAAPFPLVKELQVANGYHVTKGTRRDCYINYTNMKYNATSVNNTDYSVITTSGLRFATFGWKTASSGTNYSALSFTITYSSAASSPLSLNNNLVIFTGTAEKLYVFYKVEDQVSLLPTNGTSATSVWLDANGTLGTAASALTYYVDSTGNYTQIRGGVTSGATSNATSFTFPNVFIPSFATIGKDVRIFCRIGIPMNYNFAFTTISATLS